MVTFKVGENFFLGDGQIYVKLLPSGESVQLTRGRERKYGPVFTPDGSRVAYTQLETTRDGLSWDTFTVPVLGGEPTRLLPNASGLTFLASGRVLFAEIRGGLHMGIVAATERRSEARDVYFPPHQLGMAHFAHASPDGQWILVVEMDQTHAFGLPCRLIPADGRSAGREVGPAARARPPLGLRTGSGCTSAPASAAVRISGASGFPTGRRSKSRYGPTEEEGVTVRPMAGRSSPLSGFVAAPSGFTTRPVSGRSWRKGIARLPRLSQDGRRVFFLLRPAADSDSSELRVLELATGAVQTVIPGRLDRRLRHLQTTSPRSPSRAGRTESRTSGSPLWIDGVRHGGLRQSADQVSFGPGG